MPGERHFEILINRQRASRRVDGDCSDSNNRQASGPAKDIMPRSTIGVGIIGASPAKGGWAITAHIPALQALPDYRLVAVSTNRRESADAASRTFGVPACDSHEALIAHPDVDLVVVTEKVPLHSRMVSAAVKWSIAEWPLATAQQKPRDCRNTR
jgi:hypothetical protein